MNTIDSNPYELATGTIQRLLYEKPLYNYIDNGNVNIVVFGFTLLCRRFIDIAFELAQVNGYKLNIKIICADKNAKEQFLTERPAFTQFFDVDDTVTDCSYGHLSFQTVEQNANIDSMVSDVLWDGKTKYAYLFVDCGNDEQNYDVALKCKDCESDLDYRFSIINCALTTSSDTDNSSINIVAKDETIENHNDYAELKRMALNCHLLWNQSEFISIEKHKENFNSEYNFSSSLSSVLAIKYKLNSVGIDILDEKAAEKFSKLVNNADTKIVSLIQKEHQRWNVNKICDGWSPMRDLRQCLNGRIDENKKLHPCLVPCDAKIVLDHNWKEHNHEKWNTASEEKIQQLDSLDQVSVKIHRIFKEKAEEVKSQKLLLKNDICNVQKLIPNRPDIDIAFSKYVLCLRALDSGVPNQAKLYDYYKNELINALNNESNNLPENILENIKSQIQAIESKFLPILESERYIDYKNTDAKLIKEIPFILTYRTDWHVGIPLNIETGKGVNNQILFDNISSLLRINPAYVTYFCKYSLNEQSQIMRALKYAVNCLKMHNVSTNIKLCLISDKKISENEISIFSNLSSRICKVDTIAYKNEDELENRLIEFINYGDFFAIEKNNSLVSGLLYAFRCYKNNPYYTFSSAKRDLKCCNGCRALSYIPFKAHLKVSDLFEAKGSKDTKNIPDFQQEYKYFWNLYRDKDKSGYKSIIWKRLCNALDKTNKNENIFRLDFSKNSDVPTTKKYSVESRYADSFAEILECLQKNKNTVILNQECADKEYKVNITSQRYIHGKIDKILSRLKDLTDPSDLDISDDCNGVEIYFNSLNVNKFYVKTMNEEGTSSKGIIKILEELHTRNYISDLKSGADGLGEYYSFRYSSHQVKSVLTSAGRILELYVYYKALEYGKFDEVANSIEVTWNKENVGNEFDVIITSGLQCIIIECKAQTTLKQDFYYKLFMLNNMFGINSIPVIIADTSESLYDRDGNDLQRSRGNEIGITTIYKNEDFLNIGKVLNDLLKTN